MAPAIVGLLFYFLSLISLHTGISVAIIENFAGTFDGNLDFKSIFMAQKWFMPVEDEDLLEENGNQKD
jgi:hypothetical protein